MLEKKIKGKSFEWIQHDLKKDMNTRDHKLHRTYK